MNEVSIHLARPADAPGIHDLHLRSVRALCSPSYEHDVIENEPPRVVKQTTNTSETAQSVDQYEELVTAYLDHAEAVSLRREGQDLPPALDQVDDLIRQDPETAWAIVQELVRRATRDEVLAYIAAGPLENLLCNHPHAFIDRVEVLAARDAPFRWALSGVWGWERMPDDGLARLDALFGDGPRL